MSVHSSREILVAGAGGDGEGGGGEGSSGGEGGGGEGSGGGGGAGSTAVFLPSSQALARWRLKPGSPGWICIKSCTGARLACMHACGRWWTGTRIAEALARTSKYDLRTI